MTLNIFPNKVVQRVVKISEITLIYKNNQKMEKNIKFKGMCWPLKLCLHDFAGQSLHCSIIPRGKGQSLCDIAGQGTKGP